MKSAQKTRAPFSNFGTGLKDAGAGIAAAARLAWAGFPFLGVAALGTAVFSASAQRVDSAVMLAPGTSLPGQAYIDYGANFANSTVAIKRVSVTTGVVSYGSGLLISDSSGLQFVVTAAHVLDSTIGLRPAASLSILTGNNYFSPTSTRSVLNYAVHNSYPIGLGSARGSQIDLAIMQIDSPLVGLGVSIGTQALPNGVVLDFAGYGQFGLYDNPLAPKDGYIRAFQSFSVDPSGLFDNQIYNASSAVGLSSDKLGYGAPGDSGGGVYYNGMAYGIITAGSEYRTTYLDLTSSEVQSAIADFRNIIIPEPSVLGLAGCAAWVFASKRKRTL